MSFNSRLHLAQLKKARKNLVVSESGGLNPPTSGWTSSNKKKQLIKGAAESLSHPRPGWRLVAAAWRPQVSRLGPAARASDAGSGSCQRRQILLSLTLRPWVVKTLQPIITNTSMSEKASCEYSNSVVFSTARMSRMFGAPQARNGIASPGWSVGSV